MSLHNQNQARWPARSVTIGLPFAGLPVPGSAPLQGAQGVTPPDLGISRLARRPLRPALASAVGNGSGRARVSRPCGSRRPFRQPPGASARFGAWGRPARAHPSASREISSSPRHHALSQVSGSPGSEGRRRPTPNAAASPRAVQLRTGSARPGTARSGQHPT
jgi:hypothetical protein